MSWDWLVALGTILLAIATFMSVLQGRKQMQTLLRQVNLQVGQQIPHLFIQRVTFERDSVKIDVENATNVPAFWLGLETRFHLIRQSYSDSADGGREITWGEAIKLKEAGKIVYGKYLLLLPHEWPKLVQENREVKPETAVTFFAPQGVSMYFPPKSTIQVSTTPRFAISWMEKDNRTWQGLEYIRFRDFLLRNNIDRVAVSMMLVCKDASEKPVAQDYVASFLIVTATDKSLEDSSKNAQKFDFLPLSQLDTLSDKYWITEEVYDNIHSNWHVLE
jgi:hypothetical protein